VQGGATADNGSLFITLKPVVLKNKLANFMLNSDKLTTNIRKDLIAELLFGKAEQGARSPSRVAVCPRSGSPPIARLSQTWCPMIELPPENVRRWMIRHKAAVLTAVAAGEITREEICRRYRMSEEEFLSWQRDYEGYGMRGLRTIHLQNYRRAVQRRAEGSRASGPRHR
jgi:Protein of unknown function (DUF1153)